jgi:hypothetical protein
VASYGTYLEAQRAVDHLSDKQFPVQFVTIVGTDLRMVERVTGRLSYARVALAGAASGAWFGTFVGLLLLWFSPSTGSGGLLYAAIAIGAAFGMLFSVISYSFTRGKRDFTSQSQIVASSYSVLCAQAEANKARNLLREIGGVRTGWMVPPVAQEPAATPPSGPTPPTMPPSGPTPPITPTPPTTPPPSGPPTTPTDTLSS